MEYVGLAVATPLILIALAWVIFWSKRRINIRRARRNVESSEKIDKVLVSQFRTEGSQTRADRRDYR